MTKNELDKLIEELEKMREEGRIAAGELRRLDYASLTYLNTQDAIALINSIITRLSWLKENFSNLAPVWRAANKWHECEWTEAIVRKTVSEYLEGRHD